MIHFILHLGIQSFATNNQCNFKIFIETAIRYTNVLEKTLKMDMRYDLMRKKMIELENVILAQKK